MLDNVFIKLSLEDAENNSIISDMKTVSGKNLSLSFGDEEYEVIKMNYLTAKQIARNSK